MGELKIGIIGAGGIAGAHVNAMRFYPQIRIIGVCEPDASKREAQLRKWELKCPGCDEASQLLQLRPEVMVICAPHGLHARLAIEALRAGCHVLVEKPMAVNSAECAAMLAAARDCRKQIIVAEQASFNPGPVLTGQKFKSGQLGGFLAGRLTSQGPYFSATRPAWFLDSALSGGGMFINVGMHGLAVVRAALPGLHPASVCAEVGRVPEYQVEACVSLMVRYREGGAVHYEYLGYYPRVAGIEGAYLAFTEGLVTWDNAAWRMQSRTGQAYTEAISVPPQNMFAPVYENVIRAARGEPFAPRAEEYAEDVAIAEAAYASGRQRTEIFLQPLKLQQKSSPGEVT